MSDSIDVCELDDNGLCKTHAAGSPGDFKAQHAIVADVIKAIGKAGMDLSLLGIALADSAEVLAGQNRRIEAAGGVKIREMEVEVLAILTPVVEALRTAIRGVKAIRNGLPPLATLETAQEPEPEPEVDLAQLDNDDEPVDESRKHPCGGSW